MDTATRPRELDRRKQVRLRLRADLQFTRQKYEGKTHHVVKDPVSLRYYRFNEQEYYVISQFDGTHTLDETQKAFEKEFRPHRLTLEDLEHFARQLLQAGLVQHESPGAGKTLFDRRAKQRRLRRVAAWSNILYIKIPIFDPDWLLNRMLPKLSWIFTRWFLTLSLMFMVSAILLVGTHFQTFYDKLPSYHEFFNFHRLLYMWIALGIVKVIHEFGHGLSCKAFGGECHEMGALFLCFSPCLYCNVSDSWTLPNKWHRILISFAGIYVELIIAAASTWIWWYTPAHPFVNNVALCLMTLCSISTVVFNANPLMRFDGYYMMADWLEIPNLRDRSNRFLKQMFQEHCLGIEVPPEAYMATTRKLLFISYAVGSYIYRWVVTFGILYFFHRWLKPYGLGSISDMLVVASIGSMVGWPIYRGVKAYMQRGRLPDMKRGRVTVTATVFVLLVLAFFALPLPIGNVRNKGLVQVPPEYLTQVSPSDSGVIAELTVRNGDTVREGQRLAAFTDPPAAVQLSEAQRELVIARELVNNLIRRLDNRALLVADRSSLGVELAHAKGELTKKQEAVRSLKEHLDRLHELRAPRSGRVIGMPEREQVGQLWEKSDQRPFCRIGDPTHLQILFPVTPGEYRLLQDDLDNHRNLAVSIHIPGRGSQTFAGRIRTMPRSAAEDVPIQLTAQGGGSLATKPPDPAQPNKHEPQEQVYLVLIEITNPDAAICPGILAQVKIHCRWQTGAWWAWRKINDLFDLGLL